MVVDDELQKLLKFIDKQWLEHLDLSKQKTDKTMTHKEAHLLCAGIYMEISHKLQMIRDGQGYPDELWMRGSF